LVRFPRVYDLITSQWRYRTLYRFGLVHERDFRALPLLVREPSPLVLDVGGNNGQSVLSIKRVLPNARVKTFEPASRHYADLRALEAKLSGVELVPIALADADGEAELFWPIYNGGAMHGLASLDRSEAESWLGPDRIYGYDPRRLEVASERVTLRRLDELDLEPAIVKIDVQGTEHAVLAGGLRTIEQCRPAVMAEALADDGPAARLLAPLGYAVYTFRDGRFERGASRSATNHFLITPERLP
jgi:FkbM family methyltransferase